MPCHLGTKTIGNIMKEKEHCPGVGESDGAISHVTTKKKKQKKA